MCFFHVPCVACKIINKLFDFTKRCGQMRQANASSTASCSKLAKDHNHQQPFEKRDESSYLFYMYYKYIVTQKRHQKWLNISLLAKLNWIMIYILNFSCSFSFARSLFLFFYQKSQSQNVRATQLVWKLFNGNLRLSRV